MNINDVRTILSLICMNLDRQVPAGLEDLWAATLADIPAEYGKAAAMECIQSSPYMPKVADIRERAEQMRAVDVRTAERGRRLALERAKVPEPERRPDGAELAAWVWKETRKRANGVTDAAKRVEISRKVVDEWRQSHPDATGPARTGRPCDRRDCRCTHTDGCDGGWIEIYADEDGRDRVMPCPNCDFRRSEILRAGDRREVAQQRLRDVSDVKKP